MSWTSRTARSRWGVHGAVFMPPPAARAMAYGRMSGIDRISADGCTGALDTERRSAVDDQVVHGHVAGVARQEEHHRGGDVLRCGQAAQRDADPEVPGRALDGLDHLVGLAAVG